MKVTWQSPSNIALIKYWGKFGNQYPMNPSLSLTLNNSYTSMTLEYFESNELEIDFLFENERNEKFSSKIESYLLKISSDFPWILKSKLKISSFNTFPHSSGIASSASSMSALVLCLLSIDEFINNRQYTSDVFYKMASKYSRIASGSASRSVYGGVVVWGENDLLGHNDYAVRFTEVNNYFNSFCDTIIIVDSNEKSVSSRAGHALMEDHIFKEKRYEVALKNFELLIQAMKLKDLNKFIEIVEQEALMLHSLMMTSNPSYILLKPDSLKIIEETRNFRAEKNVPICFTIDAGPNIHLLYPEKYKNEVADFISSKFKSYKIINDHVGKGPIKDG